MSLQSSRREGRNDLRAHPILAVISQVGADMRHPSAPWIELDPLHQSSALSIMVQ